jgi:hypothetical protein
MNSAMFSEKHGLTLPLQVDLVENWLRVLLNACCKHNDFIVLTHLDYKFFGKGPYVNEHCLDKAINFDGLLDVTVLNFLEAGVHQSLIEV